MTPVHLVVVGDALLDRDLVGTVDRVAPELETIRPNKTAAA